MDDKEKKPETDDKDKKKDSPILPSGDNKKEEPKVEAEPKAEPPKVEAKDEGGEVNDIDADSIIDMFLEENPDLAETPVEEWPEDAIKALQEAMNNDSVDEPNGALSEEEDGNGEPENPVETGALDSAAESVDAESAPIEEPTTDVPNDDQDFDIMELAKLVEAGDKDGAWGMLETMFGARPGVHEEEAPAPTNALDRMVTSDERVKRLASHIGSLRF